MSNKQENIISLSAHHKNGEDSLFQQSQIQLAIQDIKDGLLRWPVWLMLAYQDIKLRYRRSILGPFGLQSVWQLLSIRWAFFTRICFTLSYKNIFLF